MCSSDLGQIGKLLATAAVWIGVTIYVYDARFWSAVEVAVPMTLLSVVLAVGIELGINKLFGVR